MSRNTFLGYLSPSNLEGLVAPLTRLTSPPYRRMGYYGTMITGVQLPLLNGDSESKQTATLRQPELDLTGIRVLTVDDEPSADSGKPKRERSLG